MRTIILASLGLVAVSLVIHNCCVAQNIDSNITKSEELVTQAKHNPFSWEVDGYLDDVSPSGEWILYRTPDTWEPDDYRAGSLRILNPQTASVIVINDKITIEDIKSTFLSDSLVAVPTLGKVLIYDIECRGFNDTLVSFNDAYGLLQFSLSEDKMKAAILLQDYAMRRVILKTIDLINKKAYDVGYHSFQLEGCADYATIGNVLWYHDQLVYSLQYQLYHYKVGTPHATMIAHHVRDYALNRDQVIFTEGGGSWGPYHIRKFSLLDSRIDELKLSSEFLALTPGSIGVHNVKIDNVSRTWLSVSDKGDRCYFLVEKNDLLKKHKNILLYQDQSFSIEQSISKVPTPNGLGYKSALLISSK